jgi:peptidoglycan/LPS O-acetylase OafA/YrhL
MQSQSGHRKNNFDFLRFFAAFLVIFGHCQALLGLQTTFVAGSNVASVGVYIFLAISGYLVTESWLRQPSLPRFMLKRSLRIFPGLAAAVLLTTFALGPVMTSLPVADYLQHPVTMAYLKNIGLYIGYSLPGVFESNPFKYAVNGSLWSLPVEFFCYLLIAVFAFIPKNARFPYVAACLVLAIAIDRIRLSLELQPVVLYATNVYFIAKYSVFFIVGALIKLLAIPQNGRIAAAALAGLLVLCPFVSEEAGLIPMWFGLPYVFLTIGEKSTPVLRSWARFGDFSYGMYLYSFPLTQAIIAATGNGLSLHLLVPTITLLSVICGLASWHLVEKQALRLKGSRSEAATASITGSGYFEETAKV